MVKADDYVDVGVQEQEINYLCECGYEGFCGKTVPAPIYDILSEAQMSGDNLYVVHVDHVSDGDAEIQREGDYVLVREPTAL